MNELAMIWARAYGGLRGLLACAERNCSTREEVLEYIQQSILDTTTTLEKELENYVNSPIQQDSNANPDTSGNKDMP